MTGLVLPYVEAPSWTPTLPLLGAHVFSVFGLLVMLGVFLGFCLSFGYAKVRRLPLRHVEALATRVAIVGFLMAHWVSMLAYYPERVARDPWSLLALTSGFSSVGGFLGGALAFVVYVRRHRLRAAPLADALVFGLLPGFTLGRLGCTLVHDHPGALADAEAWLAVGPWPDGSFRYDLGLIEFGGLLVVCAWVYGCFDWRRASPGRLTAWVVTVYGLGRFPLDFLRAVDERYLGLTPAQFVCIGLVIAGTVLARRSSVQSLGRRTQGESVPPVATDPQR